MPKSWVELGIDQADLTQTCESMRHHPISTTLEEWGQKVESMVDVCIHSHYATNGHGMKGLPKAYRGRCQPRHPIKSPVYSSVPKARQGDFEPQFEINRRTTKRRVKQTRRIQNLLRRIQKRTMGVIHLRNTSKNANKSGQRFSNPQHSVSLFINGL